MSVDRFSLPKAGVTKQCYIHSFIPPHHHPINSELYTETLSESCFWAQTLLESGAWTLLGAVSEVNIQQSGTYTVLVWGSPYVSN